MIIDPSTTSQRLDNNSTLPPRVAAFLATWDNGPGAITTEQAASLIDLTPSLDRMSVLDSPFCFGTIDGILPEDLYRAVLRDWPAEASLATVTLPAEGESPAAYFGQRKAKLVENWAPGDAAPSDAETWNRTSLALRAPAFVRGLFTRFSDIIEANLEALDPSPDSLASFKLYTNFDHGAKEALGAHVDALRKLLTIVVYLDLSGDLTDDSPQLWGTRLYDAEPGAVKPLNFSSNADRTVARQVEFVPNRAWVMPNTSSALHGVAGGQQGVMRRTLMCGYWLTPRQ